MITQSINGDAGNSMYIFSVLLSSFPPSHLLTLFQPHYLLTLPWGHWHPSSGPCRGYSHDLEYFSLRCLTHLPPSRLFKFHLPSKTYPVYRLRWKPCSSLPTISPHHILLNLHSIYSWLTYQIMYMGFCSPLQLEERLHRLRNFAIIKPSWGPVEL